ncbi:MAG: class B sortase [Oscillospiraceae bacterium]|nr:class B sortase [Oscillospiraceae bacterium]
MNIRRFIFAALYVLGFAIIVFASYQLITILGEERVARSEYSELREVAAMFPNDGSAFTEELTATAEDDAFDKPVDSLEPLMRLAELNPDFVGWIEIFGTLVDYPIVQGSDNSFYLRRTFLCERNRAGSVFMDFRAEPDFHTPLTFLYGHNMRDDSMFSTLMWFQDKAFLDSNTEIRIITATGELLTYEIISAWSTDVWDEIYSLDFQSASAVSDFFGHGEFEHFLALSTCLTSARQSSDERFVVVAGRR